MQKRANSTARRDQPSRCIARWLAALSLASGVAAVDLIDARSTRCSGEARTLLHVATAQTGPQGTSAEYSTCRTGWINQWDPETSAAISTFETSPES